MVWCILKQPKHHFLQGPHTREDEKKFHAYYQWVPLTLFFQGIMFYFPHWLWKQIEDGRLKVTFMFTTFISRYVYFNDSLGISASTYYIRATKSKNYITSLSNFLKQKWQNFHALRLERLNLKWQSHHSLQNFGKAPPFQFL